MDIPCPMCGDTVHGETFGTRIQFGCQGCHVYWSWPAPVNSSNPNPPIDARRRTDMDLHDQLESILDTVWRCEAEWRLDDRIALAVRNW